MLTTGTYCSQCPPVECHPVILVTSHLILSVRGYDTNISNKIFTICPISHRYILFIISYRNSGDPTDGFCLKYQQLANITTCFKQTFKITLSVQKLVKYYVVE